MSGTARQWMPWIALTLAFAALVHMGSVYAIPRLVMARALSKMGTLNAMHVGKPPNAASRGVVRPSPDLLYAVCPYDLAKGPLRISAVVPHDDYWSVSAFDAATNNFFVRNDRQVEGNTLEILLVRPHQPWPALGNALERVILFSPTEKGLVLFRAVIGSEKDVPAVEAVLHKSRCETVASSHGLG